MFIDLSIRKTRRRSEERKSGGLVLVKIPSAPPNGAGGVLVLGAINISLLQSEELLPQLARQT